MPLYSPRQAALSHRLAHPHHGLVVCFCAAWCDTCRAYQAEFATLADDCAQHVFVWADIEEYPDLLGEADIENFPTLLIANNGKPCFFGPVLPQIGHVRRMLGALLDDGGAAAGVAAGLPADWLTRLAGTPAAGPIA